MHPVPSSTCQLKLQPDYNAKLTAFCIMSAAVVAIVQAQLCWQSICHCQHTIHDVSQWSALEPNAIFQNAEVKTLDELPFAVVL